MDESSANRGPILSSEDESLPSIARRRAVALRYDPSVADAPKMVASGTGLTAQKILDLARQHNVPVREDPQLVQALAALEIGEMIPPQLYFVVAELFAWLYRLDRDSPFLEPPGRLGVQ